MRLAHAEHLEALRTSREEAMNQKDEQNFMGMSFEIVTVLYKFR